MTKKDLTIIRNLLIQRKAEFLNKVKTAKRNISNGFTEEVGDEIDAAVQNKDKEMSFEIAANDQIIMEEINEALGKLEKGAYGACECCGEAITIQRLKAIPWSRYCIKCQQEAERPKR
ncbi:MAG: TraR/DksA C4-type zinc finger protein [Elusimicrobiota bacterium]|jgi:DnaK suppressor protein|nr:TraR/DksA C4-type zinc finger protein [Elusimicrobiota bacterium]